MAQKQWLKYTTLAGGIALALTGLTACNGDKEPSQAAKTPLTKQAGNTTEAKGSAGMGKIVAYINGKPLYQENLNVIQKSLPSPMPEHRLVERMVELRLLAEAARKAGLDQDPSTHAQIENAVDNQLANDYLTKHLSDMQVPDQAIQKQYDAFVKNYPSKTEYKAAHILVKTKKEAEDIIKQLDNGASFAKLAKKDSKDPGSAKNGGELGWFDPEQMVPEFSAAVEKLSKGHITQQPVQSKFGWHVIKLENTRKSAPPTLDQLKPQLERKYRRQQIEDLIKNLRAKAKVKIVAANIPAKPKKGDQAKGEANPAAGGPDQLPVQKLKALP